MSSITELDQQLASLSLNSSTRAKRCFGAMGAAENRADTQPSFPHAALTPDVCNIGFLPEKELLGEQLTEFTLGQTH